MTSRKAGAPASSSAAQRRGTAAAAANTPVPAVQQLPPDERQQCASDAAPVVLQYGRLVPAQLLKRYKRFLGDVMLDAQRQGLGASAAVRPPNEAEPGEAAVQGMAEASLDGSAVAAATAAEAGTGRGEAGDVTVVHVPNTGPMAGLLDDLPARALLSVSSDPKRKYAHTLEWVQQGGEQGTWVGTHSAKANAMVRCLLEARLLPGLPPYQRIQPEVKYGVDGKSRVDFVLHASAEENEAGGAAAGSGTPAKRRRSPKSGSSGSAAPPAAPAAAADGASVPVPEDVAAAAAGSAGGGGGSGCMFLEVKSVTLAEDRPAAQGGGRIALFPDTVSQRAQRHVKELTAIAAGGGGAALVFVVQRNDCAAFAPCHEKDPAYGRLVREAAAAGVTLLPIVCVLDPEAGVVRFKGLLPLDLDYKWSGA